MTISGGGGRRERWEADADEKDDDRSGGMRTGWSGFEKRDEMDEA